MIADLRRLMLRLDVRQLEELNADIIGQAIYNKDIPAEDEWKVQGARELIEAKHDTSILPNFSTKEIEVLFHNIGHLFIIQFY